jgi:carbonic anhydrase
MSLHLLPCPPPRLSPAWAALAVAIVSASFQPAQAADGAHDARGAAAAAATASAPAQDATDPMDSLRQRLAERLGAKKPVEGKSANVMRVDNHVAPGPAPLATAPAASAILMRAGPRPGAPKRADAPAEPHAATPANRPSGPWDYAGAQGPESWGRLKPEFSACASGQRQSPIDIRGGIAVQLEPIVFDYRASGFSVIDNGHTVQVNPAPGNGITVLGRRFELLQFHFHRPSEERINGRQYEMVVHLVHKDADGKLAVIAVLLDRGAAQPLIQAVWNALPLEKNEAQAAPGAIDLNRLLPEDRRYYTYMGSLTTPPCSEGVLWMVMKTPVPVSLEQIEIFSHLYPMNARPVQQAAGRLIKESN